MYVYISSFQKGCKAYEKNRTGAGLLGIVKSGQTSSVTPDIRCSNPSHLNKRFSSKCSRGSLLQWLHCQLLFSRGVLDILLRMLGLYVISQAGILWVWQFTVITIDTDHVVDGPLVLGNVRLNQGCQIYLRFQNQFSKLFKNAINKKKYHRHLTPFWQRKALRKKHLFCSYFKTPVYTTKLKKKRKIVF